MKRQLTLQICAVAASAVLAAIPVSAQAPELQMLSELRPGSWELRFRSDGSQARICVRSGLELIQVRHSQPDCRRFVVQDQPNEVTVQYTCEGDGYGRTTIRREGNGLIQIQSRGIQGGLPFSVHGEGRHLGRC